MNYFRIFLLLTWKNWAMQLRNPIRTIFEILVPCLMVCPLCLLNMRMYSEKFADKYYEEQDIYLHAEHFPIKLLYWSPCGNKKLNDLMNVIGFLRGIDEICFANHLELAAELSTYKSEFIAGVQFDDALADATGLPKKLHATLRFPKILSVRTGSVDNWATDKLYMLHTHNGTRDPFSSYGAMPSYLREGFLSLQYDLGRQAMRMAGAEQLPEIDMQRFPYPAWFEDYAVLDARIIAFSFLLALAYIVSCGAIAADRTTEKILQIKEILKMMGVPCWMYWITWFLKILAFLLIASILVMVILQIPLLFIYEYTTLCPLTSVTYLLLIFTCYLCSLISFCFVVGSLCSKAITAAIVAPIVWVVTALPFYLLHILKTRSLSLVVFCCFLPNVAMGYICYAWLVWEIMAEGVQSYNAGKPIPEGYNQVTLRLMLIMLIIDSILYFLLALYVEHIKPGPNGFPKVWYFLFTKTFWSGGQENGLWWSSGSLAILYDSLLMYTKSETV